MSRAEALLAVHAIGKRFADRQVIADISLTAHAGEIIGLVGANGGGKTTTLRMLAGLLKVDSGSGTVLGFDLLTCARRIRGRVGYMAQGASFYPSLSVRENLRFRAAAFAVAGPRQAVEQLLRDYGLLPFAAVRADRLSGGWARLLQLAGALIHRPSLLLLDEPTAGLDIANRHQVWERIAVLARRGVAVVLSTHDLADAERCAQLRLLSEGVTLAAGAPSDIIAGAGVAVLAITGDEATALPAVLAAQPGVLACYAQGNSLRVVMDSSAQQRIIAQLESSSNQWLSMAPTLADVTLALLRRRESAAT